MENINTTERLNLNNDTMSWIEKKMAEEKKVEQRQNTLELLLKDEKAKYLYDHGLKDQLDKDPTILDNTKSIEMAMQMVRKDMEFAELKANQQKSEVKQEEQQPASTGPATQVSSANTSGNDSGDRRLGSLRDLDPNELQKASIGGKVAAAILSGNKINRS